MDRSGAESAAARPLTHAPGNMGRRPGKSGAGVGARPERQEKTLHEDGMLKVPNRPGIGVTPVEAAIKEDWMPGEPYWD